MVKLGLALILVFVIVQLTLAARVPRDTESSTPSVLDDINRKAQEGFDSFRKGASDLFSKDNVDKIWSWTADAGEKITSQGKEIAQNVQTRYNEWSKSADSTTPAQ